MRHLMRTRAHRLPLSDSQMVKGEHQMAAFCEAELVGTGDVFWGPVHGTQSLQEMHTAHSYDNAMTFMIKPRKARPTAPAPDHTLQHKQVFP